MKTKHKTERAPGIDTLAHNFSDTVLRAAIAELKLTDRPLDGVFHRLRHEILNVVGPSMAGSARIAESLIFEEAAERWARSYDKVARAKGKRKKAPKSALTVKSMYARERARILKERARR